MTTRTRDRARRAFTIAELLLVLALLSIMAAVMAPNLARWSIDNQRRALAAEVVAALHEAQVLATERGAPAPVVYDPVERVIATPQRALALPPRWRVSGPGVPDLTDPREASRWKENSPPVTLLTWSPGGLVSACDWRLTRDGEPPILVHGDAIDGLRVE